MRLLQSDKKFSFVNLIETFIFCVWKLRKDDSINEITLPPQGNQHIFSLWLESCAKWNQQINDYNKIKNFPVLYGLLLKYNWPTFFRLERCALSLKAATIKVHKWTRKICKLTGVFYLKIIINRYWYLIQCDTTPNPFKYNWWSFTLCNCVIKLIRKRITYS